jgi:hypothetical protein
LIGAQRAGQRDIHFVFDVQDSVFDVRFASGGGNSPLFIRAIHVIRGAAWRVRR